MLGSQSPGIKALIDRAIRRVFVATLDQILATPAGIGLLESAGVVVEVGMLEKEFELALDTLEEIGHLVSCRGGFWRDSEKAAESMGLVDRLPALRKSFLDALKQKSNRLS